VGTVGGAAVVDASHDQWLPGPFAAAVKLSCSGLDGDPFAEQTVVSFVAALSSAAGATVVGV
jgi:hypothetical protein